jgi:hypothetical protein
MSKAMTSSGHLGRAISREFAVGSAIRGLRIAVGLVLIGMALASTSTVVAQEVSWRYYRPSNTGIQGDYVEALWIGPDGDPYFGGYDPGYEEGGFSKFVQAENRWVNYSNVDYPVIGHPQVTGTTRVSDIVADQQGRLWLATWRGALTFDPAVGAASLVNLASQSAALASGGCRDLDIAPDGTIWFALLGYGGASGGLLRHNPATNDWHYWTGASDPQGGNGWPFLVWSVRTVSIQPKPNGGYLVWCDSENSTAIVSFDTATQLFTHHEFSFTVGALADMPGKDCVDDAGNVWIRRFAGFDQGSPVYNLDYLRPDGTWVSPAQPPLPVDSPPSWAFRAFGDRQALLVDGNGRVRRFDGTSWSDLGIWRQGAFTGDVNIDGAGNVWVCGVGGAAKRDAATGQWQRYRVTNTSQYDYSCADLSLDAATGTIYACANAGPGIGGLTTFDGVRWVGYNEAEYGLGVPWPFPTDNSEAVGFRPSSGHVVVNPMYNGLHEWNGTGWADLNGMSRSRGLVEDSLGRLWSLGESYSLQYHNGTNWVVVPSDGASGNNLQSDPDRPGTVWVSTFAEVIRTDGSYRYSLNYLQVPELDPQSDYFHTVAAGPNGTAWLGTTQGMFRIDANTGTYQYFTSLGGISCLNANPLAVTPDGRVWFAVADIYGDGPHGLAWYDGTTAGLFPAPRDGGPQWGGLPHAQIEALQVREIPGAYELWMSCASRGLAVLTVPFQGTTAVPGDFAGDTQVRLRLAPNQPNPVNGGTAISFDLPRAQRSSLAVFDLRGRLVRTLVDQDLAAGPHRVQWDGHDAAGVPVASGIYFARLRAGGEQRQQRMVVVR